MAFNDTIRGDRLHIAFFGRRNAGKSSLINALTGQEVAIVSAEPGTTTDPVYKSMELLPVGPVTLIDTAGLDDDDASLGEIRVKRARDILRKTDLALVVCDASAESFDFEQGIIAECGSLSIPVIIVLNKRDLGVHDAAVRFADGKLSAAVSAKSGEGIDELKNLIREKAPKEWEPPFLRDLVRPGDTVLLITPIDLGAPKGRLIMPQIKALRDALDADAIPVMCKERELLSALANLSTKPALAVTDSQVFPQVDADLPTDIPFTSFSILSARQKGNLDAMIESVFAVKNLKPGDRVLIAESCSHHPLEDDIARVKIPRWLNQYVGGDLAIDTVPGSRFPDDLEKYKLVVHCGG
ncbi:MAG TPA: [FeFe] hydrogenase H-cluster maturation GTPase HydF, partial [Spirochaetota bacterium]|nr:[FeFe] hydrogenase H-cluster maturation GTPase HydF [Spirochaetota bacterium]